ncbi:hypothetical protein ACTHOQ_15215, partial [Solibacillus silvestris]|uniref:hypothetical protein n=1 Tax=Solibacillus silvestris TaxID=76853 RepID=UPI003F80987F
GEGKPECGEDPDCPNAVENPECEGNEEENPHCPNAVENPDCEGNEEENPHCPDGEGNPECGERVLLNAANSSIKQTAPLKSKVRKEKRIARGIKLVKLL